MAWDFTVDSDIQLEMAKYLKGKADELDTQFANLYTQIGPSNLGTHWVGSDYDAFNVGCEGYKQALADMTDSVRMYASHFEKVAEGTDLLSSLCISIVQNMTTRGDALPGSGGAVSTTGGTGTTGTGGNGTGQGNGTGGTGTGGNGTGQGNGTGGNGTGQGNGTGGNGTGQGNGTGGNGTGQGNKGNGTQTNNNGSTAWTVGGAIAGGLVGGIPGAIVGGLAGNAIGNADSGVKATAGGAAAGFLLGGVPGAVTGAVVGKTINGYATGELKTAFSKNDYYGTIKEDFTTNFDYSNCDNLAEMAIETGSGILKTGWDTVQLGTNVVKDTVNTGIDAVQYAVFDRDENYWNNLGEDFSENFDYSNCDNFVEGAIETVSGTLETAWDAGEVVVNGLVDGAQEVADFLIFWD